MQNRLDFWYDEVASIVCNNIKILGEAGLSECEMMNILHERNIDFRVMCSLLVDVLERLKDSNIVCYDEQNRRYYLNDESWRDRLRWKDF